MSLVLAAALGAALCGQQLPPIAPEPVYTDRSPFADAPLPAPADSPMTRPAFELGRRLFHEPALSASRNMSCASCHRVDLGYSTREREPLGIAGLRHTPSLYNRAFGTAFSWDGKASTLEEQVLLPIENPQEMALAIDDAVARLAADAGYRERFTAVYSGPPSRTTLSRALATFVRSLTLGPSPADRFLAGDRQALTVDERAGAWIYESKGKCWRCHVRPNFTDERFHNTGVGVVDGAPPDPGRFAISGDPADRGAFKTPTLRGVSFNAPYMHDGSLATLEDVVAFYRRGGNQNPALSPLIEPLELTDDDARKLVAFLHALSRPAAEQSARSR